MFYRESLSESSLPYKSSAAFFTNNKPKLLQLIEELDKNEFEVYGTDKAGKFLIPIYQLTPDENNNFLLPNTNSFQCGYYGKYEIDIAKLNEICDQENVEFFLHIDRSDFFNVYNSDTV